MDRKWLPYLIACCYALTAEQTWSSDVDRAIGEANDIILQLETGIACPDVPLIGGGSDCDCMGCCIRIENGVLQTLNCGVWTDVPGGDIGAIVRGTSPVPDNVPAPEPGGCENFWMQINGTQPVLLPVTVNAGDSILIDNWNGAWSDGAGAPSFSQWFCADGGTYLLGSCTGITSTSGADPLPTANHMSVVAMVEGASAFLAPMGSARYVPPGVTDGAVYLQANDNSLSDNLGGVSVHVVICRAAEAPIGISYINGNGPASVRIGDVITITSTTHSTGIQRIDMTFTECITFTVEASTGWTAAGNNNSPAYRDCVGSYHNHFGSDVAPETWLININGDEAIVEGGTGVVFQILLRVIA